MFEEDEIPSYLKEMQILLTADLINIADKQVLTLEQIVRRMRAMGMADKEIESTLLKDLHEGGQIFGDFRKALKATVKAGIEDAGQAGIRETVGETELWDWLGIADTRICDECLRRHNMEAKEWDDWRKMGLPRTGATPCGQNCRCDLVPAGRIEKDEMGFVNN